MDPIVKYSLIAVPVGMIFGWLPGLDVPFILYVWYRGTREIIDNCPCPSRKLGWRLILGIAVAASILNAGMELAASIFYVFGLAGFYIVNIILDGVVTYLFLHKMEKLFCPDDGDGEVVETFIEVLLECLRIISLK